jgi:acyl-CoA synthetase (AMP-forming)/AMP-acid ligase II
MADYYSHLTVLNSAASLYPSDPAFKVPQIDVLTGDLHWQSITYSEFHNDVARVARYWSRILNAAGITRRSTVGLWYVDNNSSPPKSNTNVVFRLGGMRYQDVLHIYGISRAGYVPQLFSLGLTSPIVISELLRKANARALIFDPSFECAVGDIHLSSHVAVDPQSIHNSATTLLESPRIVNGDETAFVFHTSGSTSGCPKLVPCSHRWLNAIVKKAKQICTPRDPRRQDVTVWM